MSWIESDREAVLRWLTAKIDTPYRWAGNEVKDGGFDCSGLANGALRKFGITSQDMTADALSRRFPVVELENIQPGDLLFWESRDTEALARRIVHVEVVWYIQASGRVYTIGASGGGPWTTTLSAAEKADARVKVHRAPVGWKRAVDPFGEEDI